MTGEGLLPEKTTAAARMQWRGTGKLHPPFAAERADAAAGAPAVVIADVNDMPRSSGDTVAFVTQEDLEEAMKTRPVTFRDAMRIALIAQAAWN